MTTRKEKTVVDGGNNVKAWKSQKYQRGRSSLPEIERKENDMPALEKLFDAIEKQERDLYEAAGENVERSVRAVYEELIQAKEEFDEATEEGNEEAVEKVEQECKELVDELATLIDGLEVDLHNMAIDVDALKKIVLKGYTFPDA